MINVCLQSFTKYATVNLQTMLLCETLFGVLVWTENISTLSSYLEKVKQPLSCCIKEKKSAVCFI